VFQQLPKVKQRKALERGGCFTVSLSRLNNVRVDETAASVDTYLLVDERLRTKHLARWNSHAEQHGTAPRTAAGPQISEGKRSLLSIHQHYRQFVVDMPAPKRVVVQLSAEVE